MKFLILAIAITLTFGNAHAKATAEPKTNPQEFNEWLNSFYTEAFEKGITKKTLDKTIKHAKFIHKAISLDKKQPFKILSFNDYKNKAISNYRINKANKLYLKHKTLLDKIGKKYGVQPRFIVALWGIESNFGGNMGGFKIVDSLATLSYEGRRAEFFKKELFNALKIIDDGHIAANKMKGSWAGAMGQTQFMPSSFLNLAVDGNGDGKKDIWGTKEDVFSSIANYLSKSKWDYKTTWGRKVSLKKSLDKKKTGIKKVKTLAQWQKLGVRRVNGSNLPNRPDLKASLVFPDDSGDAYLVYSNYKTILKWNRSLYFATVVGLLSDKIGVN
jgi:membrane-bound lytic murein transglycosylase B